MDLTSFKNFLCRSDVKIIIICTVTGGILQVMSKQYLKSHPEFLRDAPVTEKKYRPPRFFFTRGGAVLISKIPATMFSIYLRDAFPQNFPDLKKRNLSWLVDKKYK